MTPDSRPPPRPEVTEPPGTHAESARSDIASRDRLPSLTGLRFGAALLVVLYHLTRQVGDVQPFSALAFFGRSGVTFFFVLSGFVLAWTYLDAAMTPPVFLWRRFARLWPLVGMTGLFSLLAYAALDVAIPPPRALSTFLFLQAWRAEWVAGANPASWSLSDEAFFYVLFPVILVGAAHRRIRALLWGLVALTLPLLFLLALHGGWLDGRFDYFPPTRIVHFVLGVLCGVAMRRGARSPLGLRAAVLITVAYHAGLFVVHVTVGESNWLYRGSQWWSAIPFALLIAAAAQADVTGRRTLFSRTWFLRLGHWSFAWYLLHETVIRLAVGSVGRPAGLPTTVLMWIVLLVVTQALAGLLYSFVEHPAERWLRARGPSREGRTRHEGHSRARGTEPSVRHRGR